MENTEAKAYTQSENLNTPKTKTLEQLILFLENEVNKLEENSSTINSKLQRISQYIEPEDSNTINTELSSDSFITELEKLINKISYYNSYQSFSIRHLDTLI